MSNVRTAYAAKGVCPWRIEQGLHRDTEVVGYGVEFVQAERAVTVDLLADRALTQVQSLR